MVQTNGLPLEKIRDMPSSKQSPLAPKSPDTCDKTSNIPVTPRKKNPPSPCPSTSPSLPMLVQSSFATSKVSEATGGAPRKVCIPNKNESPASDNAIADKSQIPSSHLVSLAIDETIKMPTPSPGAIHVQRHGPTMMAPEWDNITQPSIPVRDESPGMVLAAKLVPEEEDLTELLDQRLQEKIQQAVVVEGVNTSKSLDADAANSSSSSKRYILLIFLVVVVGVVAGVTLSLKNKKDDPTASPTIQSLSPSLPPSIPYNNICSAAISIEQGNGSILGTIFNVTGSYDFNHSCVDYVEAPRVWYSLMGDGNVYAVSTCSSKLTFNAILSVSTGSCDSQECVAISTFNYECMETFALASRVVFLTEVGVEYFISVELSNSFSEGSFELALSIVDRVPNDICPAAISIDSDSGSFPGTITNAMVLHGFNYSCSYSGDAPRVWYSLVGDGNAYAISTCSSKLNFHTTLTVSGGSCDSQDCIAISSYDNECTEPSGLASRVVFSTEVGVEYLISVENSAFSSEGEFELDVSIVDPPPNDICSAAISIQPGNSSILEGTITNATWSHGFDMSCAYNAGAPRVWYSLVGDGNAYSISTCSSKLTFDSALSVTIGSCDSQECIVIGAWSYECRESTFRASRVVFSTEVGVEYLISVEDSYLWWEGEFELDVSIVDPPPNVICSAAISIQPGNSSILEGTITNATWSHGFDMSCANIAGAPRVWYSLVGDGNAYSISTCSSKLNYNATLTVSGGSCDSQDCIAISSYDNECTESSGLASRVVFPTEVGIEYLLSVEDSYFLGEGEFELNVSIVDAPPNNICSDALRIQPQNGSTVGSTENAFSSLTRNTCPDMFADSSFISPDVWYRVEGTGTNLTASMCGTRTTYDSQIAIFEGSDDECNQLCIAGNDDSCDSLGSEVEWFADLGSTYYIRVFGLGHITGSFELKVD